MRATRSHFLHAQLERADVDLQAESSASSSASSNASSSAWSPNASAIETPQAKRSRRSSIRVRCAPPPDADCAMLRFAERFRRGVVVARGPASTHGGERTRWALRRSTVAAGEVPPGAEPAAPNEQERRLRLGGASSMPHCATHTDSLVCSRSLAR